LLAASIGFFLASSGLALLGVFMVMTLITWGAAIIIGDLKSENVKKAVAAMTVAGLVIVLVLYKEISFFVVNGRIFERLTGIYIGWEIPAWAAPLGISYFTLILVGYLLDVSWGTVKAPQKNPLKMLLFAGYFPQLASGPISRYNLMQGSLYEGRELSCRSIWRGLQRVIWGTFKVLCVSTRLSVFVSAIYDAQATPGNPFIGLAFVYGAVLYVWTVYMNFSGAMDIVIGVSEMFGITLPENFERPFGGKSLSELWRRWHMTLGFFMKDYVLYRTLKSAWLNKIRMSVKNRFGKKAANNIPTYIGMFIVWFCVGFWHGGTYKFIFGSGLFFFIMIVGGLMLQPLFDLLMRLLHINTEWFFWRLFQQLRTFLLFAFSVSFGRAESFGAGLDIWKRAIFEPNLSSLFDFREMAAYIVRYTGLDAAEAGLMLAYAFGGLFLAFLVSFLQEKFGSLRALQGKTVLALNIAATVLLLFATLWIGGFDNRVDLIYGNF